MGRTISVAVVVVAVAMLAGCPKSQQAELQGAPPTPMPPAASSAMPGGEKTAGAAMPVDQGKAATEKTPAGEMASCPVLGTTMAKKDMIPYEYKGHTYYLCCAGCVPKFKANPEKYIKNPAKALPAGAPMPSN